MHKLINAIFVLGLFSLIACTQKATTFECASVSSTYTNNVKPILDASCATSGCHNATSKADGYDFSTYTNAKTHASHGHFLGSIQHLKGYEAMPKNSAKLSDADIKLISCWVQNGTPE